jgi:hypothetical protein
MQVTVLWEDQQGVRSKSFGPHELLISSVADVLGDQNRSALSKRLRGEAKKGNGNVLRALKDNPYRGPLIAVIDRDKVHNLWKDVRPPPTNCMQGQSRQFRSVAPGSYDLVFLINHTEDLLDAVQASLGKPKLEAKPSPDARDRILQRAAWEPSVTSAKVSSMPAVPGGSTALD